MRAAANTASCGGSGCSNDIFGPHSKAQRLNLWIPAPYSKDWNGR